MKRSIIPSTLVLALAAVGGTAAAQDPHVVYDRVRGETSIGTDAPTRAEMMDVIRNGPPTRIMETLEYGERVECHACVPVLEGYLLSHADAQVREFAAWWLRRRTFGIGAIIARMRTVLAGDADPVRRARAAMALGEFLDARQLEPLSAAAAGDADGAVRAAAVTALGRLNHPAGNEVIAAAMSDEAADVRRAAIGNVLRVNFFRDHAAVVGLLADPDDNVRKRAALVTGELGVSDAVPALVGMLRTDADRDARQAAAWALGRIGGSEARAALTEAAAGEEDSLVRDAIDVAMRMR